MRYAMGHRRRGRLWGLLLAPLMLLLGLGVGAIPATVALAAPRAECLGPVAGQHVYDCAHLLTASEVATLEVDAAKVDQAGAPTVVYLQVKDATAQQTWQDAVDLMNRWDVESHPGAHDGFVMVFDLQPGNLRHGQVALFAGAKHYQHGNLPQAELDRIRTDVMTPLLAEGQTAAGIAAGLQQVASDLKYGPPPPPASQVAAANFGRIPFNVLALLYAGAVVFLLLRVRRQPPLSTAADEVGGMQALAAPGDLSPGMVGALLQGRIQDAQVEATVLDFARRGLLVLEPETQHEARLRLVGNGIDLHGYELEVWNELTHLANSKSRVISSTKVAQLRQHWGDARTALRRDLIERGWYDPNAASARRQPLYIAGAIGMVAVVVAVIVMAVAQEGWAAIGLLIFLVAGVAAFVGGYRVSNTTVEGEIAAAPWRAYRASVVDRSYQPNLDADLPYIVGMGILGKLAPRLQAASEHGYAPSWFRPQDSQNGQRHVGTGYAGLGFYPYWIAFHAATQPVYSSGGSSGGGSFGGGFSGGGAAGGGGGSAGGF